MAADESNLSHPTKGNETGPIRQHKRLALGEKVNGQTNPNGAERGPTEKKIGNAPCTY